MFIFLDIDTEFSRNTSLTSKPLLESIQFYEIGPLSSIQVLCSQSQVSGSISVLVILNTKNNFGSQHYLYNLYVFPPTLQTIAFIISYLANDCWFCSIEDVIVMLGWLIFQVQGGGNAGNALTCVARLGLNPRLISKVSTIPSMFSCFLHHYLLLNVSIFQGLNLIGLNIFIIYILIFYMFVV